jgi:hypothetical protein
VESDRLVRFVDVVSTEVGDRPLHDGLVFLWGTLHAIGGGKLRLSGARGDQDIAAIAIKARLTLRIGTKERIAGAVLADKVD